MAPQVSFSPCFFLFTLVIFLNVPQQAELASFEDVRCKCVCPRSLDINGTGPVYIKNVEPNYCRCENVVPPMMTAATGDICHYCECKYENRNTTTIKVVVIFIICVVSLLFVYMLFLLCLDPLIQRRPPHYTEHTDEEEDMSVPRVSQMEAASAAAAAARQRSILNRVTDEQKKWKATVQDQRKNIYDRHTMLN